MYERRTRYARALSHLAPVAAALVLVAPWSALAAEDGKAFIWDPDAPELEWTPCPVFMPADCGIAVLQGDPAKPNADVFFRLPGNTTVPHHWHTSAERMVLVSGKMQVDYDDQEPVVLRPGTYAYGPSRLAHTTHCISDEPCILFIAFEEPVDAHPTDGGLVHRPGQGRLEWWDIRANVPSISGAHLRSSADDSPGGRSDERAADGS